MQKPPIISIFLLELTLIFIEICNARYILRGRKSKKGINEGNKERDREREREQMNTNR